MKILTTLANLLSRRKKVEPTPLDLDKWVKSFRKAPAERKSEIATQWLQHYLANIDRLSRWEAHDVEAVIRLTLLPKIDDVRKMLTAVKPGCTELMDDDADSVTVSAMKRYLDLDKDLEPAEWPSYYAARTRLRTMLLDQNLEARLAAFYELVSVKTNLREMHKGASALLKAATWNLAEDEGMSNTMTAAATKLLVWSHLFRPLPFTSSRQPQCHAIESLLWDAQCGVTSGGSVVPIDTVKEILIPHPAAAATLLYYLETESTFTTRRDIHLHSRTASEEEKLQTLLDWLPQQSGMVSLAQQLGLSYMETLERIMESFNPQQAADLPDNIELGTLG